MTAKIKAVDNLLPQTQCTKCGYKDCYDYAQAIINNGEEHNRCPPGGQEGSDKLATFLKRETLKLNENCGTQQPKKVAWINESMCIGCMKCILACPVDAIIGAKNLMHTVITEECTGCDLCCQPCPMDCIEMHEISFEDDLSSINFQQSSLQSHYRLKHKQKKLRLDQKKINEIKKHQQNIDLSNMNIDKKDYIKKSLAIFKAKKKVN